MSNDRRLPAYAHPLPELHRTSLAWRVSLPGREPFTVICPQRLTAHEVLQQWPGAMMEAVHGH